MKNDAVPLPDKRAGTILTCTSQLVGERDRTTRPALDAVVGYLAFQN